MADFTGKAKCKAEELAGTAKEKFGELTHDDDLQADGASDQASGNTKQTGDKITDKVYDVKDKFTN